MYFVLRKQNAHTRMMVPALLSGCRWGDRAR
jgi:hypothetical protein